jgi:hypothetical protein
VARQLANLILFPFRLKVKRRSKAREALRKALAAPLGRSHRSSKENMLE